MPGKKRPPGPEGAPVIFPQSPEKEAMDAFLADGPPSKKTLPAAWPSHFVFLGFRWFLFFCF